MNHARIGAYTIAEFLEKAGGLHGYPAPGLLFGGFMVELAKSLLPAGTLFEAIVETPKCMPDAVQLLTVCSVGNGRLRVVNLGRFALALYDKYSGAGVRVWLDAAKLDAWPEISGWLLKTTPKKEQNAEKLLDEIGRAGASVLSFSAVQVAPRVLEKKNMGAIAICPVCKEPYPRLDGGVCRGCTGEAPYVAQAPAGPRLATVDLDQAVGKTALHDMTEVTETSKGPAIAAGETIAAADLERLRAMGKNRVYVSDAVPDAEWVHENDAVLALARAMAGDGVCFSEAPCEGKITFFAARNGLLIVDQAILETVNLVPDVMVATRQSFLVVEKDRGFAGCRPIPLYLGRRCLAAALEVLAGAQLFRVLKLRPLKSAILVTGTEVHEGRVVDRFIPVIAAKLEHLGATVLATDIVPDDRKAIAEATQRLIDAGAELLVTTAGLSVDPDDVTRQGLQDAGLTDTLYGAPVLPGAMLLLGRIGQTQVMGVPACGLHAKTTAFDLLLPRVLAGVAIGRRDLARLADGGYCLSCKACTYPKCPFGK